MKEYVLRDNKNQEVKIICKIISDGISILAGENGAININDKYLTPMQNSLGYLTDIIAVDVFESGDIIVLGIDNDIGIYRKDENYKIYKIKHNIINDALYFIKIHDNQVVTWGERKTKYLLTLVS